MASALIEFTQEEKQIIKNTYFPQGTTNEEMQFCMGVAKALGLNPILKEIYFVERKAKVNDKWVTKIEPLVGRDAFLKLAHSTGAFAGIETTCEIKQIPKLEKGKWVLVDDLVATCKVYRKDTTMPFIVSVNYSEYVQLTNDGKVTKFWDSKPTTMLQKVAESQALRKAFNISGVYGEDEVGHEPIIDGEVVPQLEKPKNINANPLFVLKNKLKKQGITDADAFCKQFEINAENAETMVDDEAGLQALVEKFNDESIGV